MTSGVRPSRWQAAAKTASVMTPTTKCGMRNAECGVDGDGSIAGAGHGSRRSHAPFRTPHSAFRILFRLAERKEVREEAIGARDTSRELPEEAQPGVHVRALADGGHEEPALKRRLARIVQLDERRVGG